MARTFEEDRRRLLESRHDIAALSDPGKLTGDEALKAALVRSIERLSASRAALLAASQHNLLESAETGEARIDLDASLGLAHQQYAFVYRTTSNALFIVDPEDPALSAGEMEKRTLNFNKVFSDAIGPLSSLGPQRFLEILEGVALAMERSPMLAAMGLHGRLERAVVDLKPKLDRWKREVGEDRGATRALKDARVRFDAELQGHAEQVRSVLRREFSSEPPGLYILSEDPAYRARRQAGGSFDDEPGIKDIDDEIDAAEVGADVPPQVDPDIR